MIAAMSTGQSLWKRALVAAASVVFASQTALAAEASATNHDAWFDPQNPAPSSSTAAPATLAPPPAPSASNSDAERPSLAPSPLLENRGGNAASAASSDNDAEDRDPRALTDFRPHLDPYGTWVQHPTYGTVWIPSPSVVGNEFTPYLSNGRWALDEGNNWIWVSDYPFGGVVFHYGRWVWIGGTGWAWVPGYRYAPAWVSWRVPVGSYAYVGWAPLGPSFVWYNGYASAYWYGVTLPWYYCSSYYVFRPHVHYYVVHDRGLVNRLHANTRVYVPASGVGVRRVSTFSGPSLASARVPAQAVPSQRVRAMPVRGTLSPSAPSPFSRSSARAGAAARFPAAASPAPARPERFRAPADLSAAARSRGSFRGAAPAPRSVSPPVSPPQPPARLAPRPSAPRLAPPIAPRRPSPSAPRVTPSPRQPRSFSPSPPAVRPAPRSFSPSPRSSSPPPRSFSPAPRSFRPAPRSFRPAPAPRSFSPAPRSFSPAPRSFGPRGGGFHPRGRR